MAKIMPEFSNGDAIAYEHPSHENYAFIEMNREGHGNNAQEVLNFLKRMGIPEEAYVSSLGKSLILVRKKFLPGFNLEKAVADSTF